VIKSFIQPAPAVYCKVISGVVLFLLHLSKVLIKASRICLAVFYRLTIRHFNLLPFLSARVHSWHRFNFALLNKGLDACPVHSLNVEEVNVVKHLNLQSCVEKYEFQSMTSKYTNPSYLAYSIGGLRGHTNIQIPVILLTQWTYKSVIIIFIDKQVLLTNSAVFFMNISCYVWLPKMTRMLPKKLLMLW
jgi:hypothetical protein